MPTLTHVRLCTPGQYHEVPQQGREQLEALP